MAEKFDDDMLDDLFAAARNDSRATPSPDLLARVLSEAEGLQVADPAPVAQVVRPSLWAAVVAAVGGWPALGGVAMAGVAGVWIGVASGTTLMADTLGLDIYGETAQSYLSDLDDTYAFDLTAEE
ncbi:hypothetical protein [Shimia sagamensis]|uniref:Dihydroorotate dehydrogenase n=1 Tax=Shimia sagamensis TaxID=1566352 RepID=A0ABY1NPP0_9RHOB|nr:hypothetical protein [Shimia sagamensis]SMP14255.1 hypothetical protein SAMN06265373_102649 [Shimia sagamensis]